MGITASLAISLTSEGAEIEVAPVSKPKRKKRQPLQEIAEAEVETTPEPEQTFEATEAPEPEDTPPTQNSKSIFG